MGTLSYTNTEITLDSYCGTTTEPVWAVISHLMEDLNKPLPDFLYLSEFVYGLRNQTPGEFVYIWQSNWVGITKIRQDISYWAAYWTILGCLSFFLFFFFLFFFFFFLADKTNNKHVRKPICLICICKQRDFFTGFINKLKSKRQSFTC